MAKQKGHWSGRLSLRGVDQGAPSREDFRCLRDVSKTASMGQGGPPSSSRTLIFVFLRKPDAEPRNGIRSFRETALTSMMSKWYATCITLRLERETHRKAGSSCTCEKLHVTGGQHFHVIIAQLSAEAWGSGRTSDGNTIGKAAKTDPQCWSLAWTSRRTSMCQGSESRRN